jgi:hypothetical protein
MAAELAEISLKGCKSNPFQKKFSEFCESAQPVNDLTGNDGDIVSLTNSIRTRTEIISAQINFLVKEAAAVASSSTVKKDDEGKREKDAKGNVEEGNDENEDDQECFAKESMIDADKLKRLSQSASRIGGNKASQEVLDTRIAWIEDAAKKVKKEDLTTIMSSFFSLRDSAVLLDEAKELAQCRTGTGSAFVDEIRHIVAGCAADVGREGSVADVQKYLRLIRPFSFADQSDDLRSLCDDGGGDDGCSNGQWQDDDYGSWMGDGADGGDDGHDGHDDYGSGGHVNEGHHPNPNTGTVRHTGTKAGGTPLPPNAKRRSRATLPSFMLDSDDDESADVDETGVDADADLASRGARKGAGCSAGRSAGRSVDPSGTEEAVDGVIVLAGVKKRMRKTTAKMTKEATAADAAAAAAALPLKTVQKKASRAAGVKVPDKRAPTKSLQRKWDYHSSLLTHSLSDLHNHSYIHHCHYLSYTAHCHPHSLATTVSTTHRPTYHSLTHHCHYHPLPLPSSPHWHRGWHQEASHCGQHDRRRAHAPAPAARPQDRTRQRDDQGVSQRAPTYPVDRPRRRWLWLWY